MTGKASEDFIYSEAAQEVIDGADLEETVKSVSKIYQIEEQEVRKTLQEYIDLFKDQLTNIIND